MSLVEKSNLIQEFNSSNAFEQPICVIYLGECTTPSKNDSESMEDFVYPQSMTIIITTSIPTGTEVHIYLN